MISATSAEAAKADRKLAIASSYFCLFAFINGTAAESEADPLTRYFRASSQPEQLIDSSPDLAWPSLADIASLRRP